jgi:hypothetical protein
MWVSYLSENNPSSCPLRHLQAGVCNRDAVFSAIYGLYWEVFGSNLGRST